MDTLDAAMPPDLIADRANRILELKKSPLPSRVHKTFKNHWIAEPADDYHSHTGAIGSSSVKEIQTRSLASWKEMYPKFKDETPAMAYGTLVHKAILEGDEFWKNYVKKPDFTELYGHFNNKIHKEEKKQWLAKNADKWCVTDQELEAIKGNIESILKHEDASQLFEQGIAEVSGYYRDPVTGILCKIRPDWLDMGLNTLVDLKTTDDCREEQFQNSCGNFGHHISMAMYGEGIYQLTGRYPDFYVLLALEKKAPYECAVYWFDKAAIEWGLKKYRHCMDRLGNALLSNEWPRYQVKSKSISLPRWAMRD